MKFLTLLGTLFLLISFSCKKTVTIHDITTVTIHDTTTVTLHDTTRIVDTVKSNFDYLTGHTWMYSKLYLGYTGPSNLGVLQYQRGSSSNINELGNDRVTYYPNGTILELAQDGTSLPGTWLFTNNNQTHFNATNSFGTYPITIVKIDGSHFNFSASSGGQIEYAEMISAP